MFNCFRLRICLWCCAQLVAKAMLSFDKGTSQITGLLTFSCLGAKHLEVTVGNAGMSCTDTCRRSGLVSMWQTRCSWLVGEGIHHSKVAVGEFIVLIKPFLLPLAASYSEIIEITSFFLCTDM